MSDYEQKRAELKAEQSELTREEIAEEMRQKSEYVFDPDNAQPVKHRWIDRGAVMSCEGAMHPNHRAFKRLK